MRGQLEGLSAGSVDTEPSSVSDPECTQYPDMFRNVSTVHIASERHSGQRSGPEEATKEADLDCIARGTIQVRLQVPIGQVMSQGRPNIPGSRHWVQ